MPASSLATNREQQFAIAIIFIASTIEFIIALATTQMDLYVAHQITMIAVLTTTGLTMLFTGSLTFLSILEFESSDR